MFLKSQVPAYLAARKGSRQKFWHALYSLWWQKFLWKLDDDQEPPTNDPAKMAQLAAVAPGEEGLKKQVEKRLTDVCWTNGYLLDIELIELHFSV